MDVFGRTDQVLAGGLSADSMFMTWPDLVGVGGGLGLLIQQVGLDYRQSIRRVFEIGPGLLPGVGGGVGIDASICSTPLVTNPAVAALCATRVQPTYYIVGRPEGSLQFGRFIGPNALATCFYKKYGSPCSPNTMQITGRAGCSASDASARRVTWSLNGVTLNGLRLDVNGQEMVMQENLSGMFAGLRIDVEGDVECGSSTTTLVG